MSASVEASAAQAGRMFTAVALSAFGERCHDGSPYRRNSPAVCDMRREVVVYRAMPGKQAWAFALIAALGATDALAKDVAGMFLGAFVLAGGLVGLLAGVASASLSKVRFWRGAGLVLGLSLVPWAALLLYWDFPFAARRS